MQEQLDNNNILMHSTLNGGKAVMSENLTETLKAKDYKKWQLMIANLIPLIWIN